MFQNVKSRPEDPIDVISRNFKADTNPQKIDLGVGVYRDESGQSPVMTAVAKAEQRLASKCESKEYLTPAGNLRYCELMEPYLFGTDHSRSIISIQTPGGGPAIRIAAELIKRLTSQKKIWVPAPTWGHQLLVFSATGLKVSEYPYYNYKNQSILFSEMVETLEKEGATGDTILLHGCCHNPTGADFNEEQWQILADLCQRKALIPFIDIAYQGFCQGMEQDNFGIRAMEAKVPEMLVASTSSKSFAIYRERAGSISLVSNLEGDQLVDLRKEMLEVSRGLYFMSADHGAAIVVEILEDEQLTKLWRKELEESRLRIANMRTLLSDALNAAFGSEKFSYIKNQFGMFSLLSLSGEQIERLSSDFSVYLIPDGRINVAGLSEKSISYVAEAIHAVSTVHV
jgi:aspartate aminotransferase